MQRFDVIIVGAGHGGAHAAMALRKLKFGGTIALIGDEPEYPYERPPLSKEYLAGEKAFERLLIRPPEFWRLQKVSALLGKRVLSVSPSDKTVKTDGGETFAYGALVWAAGGGPRQLTCPGHDLAGVHVIRTRGDVDAILAALPRVRRAAVVGGGYIGLEAAAVLRKLGKDVAVLEAQERVLSRVAGKTLSRFYEAEHRAHGVDVRLSVVINAFLGENGRLSGVRLAGGEIIPADIAIVGVGVAPAVAPLLAAGAEGGDGVMVDAQCRTSLPDVYAVGDCALHANPFADGALVRLESVQNANDQGGVAAKAIAGRETAYEVIPWFWSNQYDLRLQTVGLSRGHDEALLRGDPGERSFSVVYLKQGRVIALDCVNAAADYVQGRKLIIDRMKPDKARLEDAAVSLKDLAS